MSRRRSAFTLIEVLISVSLAGLLLFGLVTFMVSITQFWTSRHDHREAAEHIVGVANALEQLFAEAGIASGERGSEAVQWSHPPGMNTFETPLLSLEIDEAPPIFVASGPSLPRVHAWLHLHPTRGLGLLWHSPMEESALEQEADINNMYWTSVSPWVESITYHYFDPEENYWESSMEPLQEERSADTYRMPDFLELNFRFFEDEPEPLKRLVALPSPHRHALVF